MVIRQECVSFAEAIIMDFLKNAFSDNIKKVDDLAFKLEAKKQLFGKTIYDEYVVFDLETTGVSTTYSNIVQIGALKIKNGEVIDTFNTYVHPQRPIPLEATEVNHITNEMVANAPTLRDVLPLFEEFINGYTLVGYNIARFDLALLNNRMYRVERKYLRVPYVDVYLYVNQLGRLENKKLATVASALDIPTKNAHDALYDCRMTYLAYEKMMRRGYRLDKRDFKGKPVVFVQNTEDTLLINELQHFLKMINSDGTIDEMEFYVLREWMEFNKSLKGTYPYDNLSQAITQILEDGIVEKRELAELSQIINEWLDPVNYSKHDKITTLIGKHVVITGDFKYGSEDVVLNYISSKGAEIDKNVIKKTDYLVVGALGSPAWSHGNYGNKVKKALEYKAKGQNIQIIKEIDFFKETQSCNTL